MPVAYCVLESSVTTKVIPYAIFNKVAFNRICTVEGIIRAYRVGEELAIQNFG